MFEIIMLFAFLLAVTSQLLPNKHASNRLTARKTDHDKKKQGELLQQSAKGQKKPRETQNAETVIMHMPHNRFRRSNFEKRF
jgi:hypothetical protein